MNRIEEIKFGSVKAVSISAGDYEAIIIPQVGANLISLRNTKKEIDVLRTPETYEELVKNPVLYGIPVLFFPNRIDRGIIKRNGLDIRLPLNDPTGTKHIHGFLHNKPWKVKACSLNIDCNNIVNCNNENFYSNNNNNIYNFECNNNFDPNDISSSAVCQCIFENHENTDIYEFFPFSFTASLTYVLNSNGLVQIFEMQNTGCREMPFGLGYHIAFNVPYYKYGNAEKCRFRVSAGPKWEINDEVLPTGRLFDEYEEKELLREKGIAACGIKFGKMSYISSPIKVDEGIFAGRNTSHGNTFHGAIIRDSSCKDSIVFETDKKFGHWVIWNGDGNSGFICIEPQTWAINAPNLDLDDEITGYQTLKPGCTIQCINKIYIVE